MLFLGLIKFQNNVPTLQDIVTDVERLSSLKVIVLNDEDERLGISGARIAFACAKEETVVELDIQCDRHNIYPGTESAISDLPTSPGSDRSEPRVKTLIIRSTMSQDYTLSDYICAACRNFGGSCREEIDEMLPINAQTLHKRLAKNRPNSWLIFLQSSIAILGILIFVFSLLLVAVPLLMLGLCLRFGQALHGIFRKTKA